MDFTFLRTANNSILKAFKQTPQTLPPNRHWIRSLKVGDVIHTTHDDETLVVLRDYTGGRQYTQKDCCLVKRSHLKEPYILKSCIDFDDCVEIIWSSVQGFKQEEFSDWNVVQLQPQESQEIIQSVQKSSVSQVHHLSNDVQFYRM